MSAAAGDQSALEAGSEGREECDVSERVLQLFSDAQAAFKAETERREVVTMETPY